MASYSMTCSCGHTMAIDAGNREEAVARFKEGMTQTVLDEHWREHHQSTEQKPTLAQAHASIEQMVKAAA
jgi:hypothetical protein